jgi:hypothetical protein
MDKPAQLRPTSQAVAQEEDAVEKEAPLTHSPSSSSATASEHGEPASAADDYGRYATKDDIEAYPTGIAETPVDGGGELSRTNTRASRASRPGIARILTRTATKSSWKDPGPPPDGGLTAWTQVAMGHLVITSTWGFVNSFGVFQAYYTGFLNRPPSDIAWIGSIQVFILFFIGTWTGRITDAGYFKEVFVVGTTLQVLGIMMASLSTSYWQLFLAQGVCVGLGNGCLFTPMMSTVSTYFSTKRSLALGLVACGSVTGGLVFPAMVQQLLPRIGFGWTLRALGFAELGFLMPCVFFLKRRLPPRRTGPIVEWAAFRELPYTFFAMGMYFTFWGVYFAFYYVGPPPPIVKLSLTISDWLLRPQHHRPQLYRVHQPNPRSQRGGFGRPTAA